MAWGALVLGKIARFLTGDPNASTDDKSVRIEFKVHEICQVGLPPGIKKSRPHQQSALNELIIRREGGEDPSWSDNVKPLHDMTKNQTYAP